MGNYEDLKAAIADVIYQNGNNEITGTTLQQTLLSMVDNLGEYATFVGVAQPNTNPGTPDQNVFYIAATPGTYVNFSNIEITSGEISIFKMVNDTWVKNILIKNISQGIFSPIWFGPEFIFDTANKKYRTGLGSRTFTIIDNVQYYVNEGSETPMRDFSEITTVSYALVLDNVNHCFVEKSWDEIKQGDIIFSIVLYPALSGRYITDFRVNYCPITYRYNGIVKDELMRNGSIVNVNVSLLKSFGGTIAEATNQVVTINDYLGAYISIFSRDWLHVIPGDNGSTIAFLKDELKFGENAPYCDGWGLVNCKTESYFKVPADAQYLYVYLESPGVDYRPQLIEYVSESFVNLAKSINETLPGATALPGSIAGATNKWASVSGYFGGIIPISGYKSIMLKAGINNGSYAFLKSNNYLIGVTPDYATGYNAPVRVLANTVVTVDVPDDAQYLYVYLESPGVDYRFDYIINAMTLSAQVMELQNKEDINKYLRALAINPLKICTWNIGHYSGGASPNTNITPENYVQKLREYRQLIYDEINADIIALEEYSAIFGNNKNAKDVIFNDYAVQFEGAQRNYSCNSLYANTYLENIKIFEFDCLKNETITHTTLINATDYYYLMADLYMRGRKIKFVVAHLAFDSNRPSILQLAQINELVSVLEDEQKIVLVGDWNVSAQSDFEPFINAGYTLANDGSIFTYPSNSPDRALDNIIVKGVNISNIGVIQNTLSDHIPMYATINI